MFMLYLVNFLGLGFMLGLGGMGFFGLGLGLDGGVFLFFGMGFLEF